MDMYDSLFSPASLLNEQIARQIFNILPENGPIMLIMDREGNLWHSNSEKSANFDINEMFIRELCDRIDDGSEPVITQNDQCTVIASQLSTQQTNCGYVILALPQSTPESAMLNTDLIEILFSQINLIAKLIEKNDLLYELQMKQFNTCGQSEITAN